MDKKIRRRGRREAPAAAYRHPSPLNPFMVSSRSSYLVQSSNEFMDSPLIHLFGIWQEGVHMEPSQLKDKKQE